MRKRLAALLPALLLLGAMLALRAADPPPLQGLRAAVFDEYQRIAPRAWADAGIRIVDIDEESLARFGQWPWPRTVVAQLAQRLSDMGAAAIAFDVVFAEPDRTSPRAILPLWSTNAEDPALMALAARIQDHDEALRDALVGNTREIQPPQSSERPPIDQPQAQQPTGDDVQPSQDPGDG